MKNIFEEIYEKVQQAKVVYREAESDEEKDKARWLYRSVVEKAEQQCKGAACVWYDYENSRDCGNKRLDISAILWEREVPEIVSCLKRNNIKSFTFSGTYTSAIEIAWMFQKEGYVVVGMVEVNSNLKDCDGNYQKRPALLFRIK